MVDGVHGHVMGHAVRHVAMEHKDGLEDVTIPHLPVKKMTVRAVMSKGNYVTLAVVVLVRLCNIISCVMCKCNNVAEREKEINEKLKERP